MSSSEEETLERDLSRVSNRIRRWREEEGISQQELAVRSGVAASTVHKVEALQMVPTVAVLLKLARGLGRSPSEFVSEEAAGLEIVHLPAAQRHPIGMSGHMLLERLTGDLFESELEVWHVEVHPGHGFGRGRVRYEGEQAVLCEHGEITFFVGEKEIVLAAGDSLHFKAVLPHGWENRGSGPARFTVIGTLPQALRAALHERLSGATGRKAAT